jgi:hypothetical protein
VFDNSGNPVAATQKVNDSTADEELPAAIIPLSSGGFAVVWKDDNELPATPDDNLDDYYVRLFNSSGTPRELQHSPRRISSRSILHGFRRYLRDRRTLQREHRGRLGNP